MEEGGKAAKGRVGPAGVVGRHGRREGKGARRGDKKVQARRGRKGHGAPLAEKAVLARIWLRGRKRRSARFFARDDRFSLLVRRSIVLRNENVEAPRFADELNDLKLEGAVVDFAAGFADILVLRLRRTMLEAEAVLLRSSMEVDKGGARGREELRMHR